MRHTKAFARILLLFAASLLLAKSAAAGPTDAEKCEADKLKQAGKYAFCRTNAESRAVKKGELPDYSKCNAKLGEKFAKAELRWGAACPTTEDVGDIQAQVTGDTDDLSTVLSGGALPPDGCGNGIAEKGESCDGLDLNGETCVSLGYEAEGLGLACTAECRLDTSACETNTPLSRFRDNGDGTATDLVSGLIWEIKNDLGGIHDKDNVYTWCVGTALCSGGAFNGTAKTAFLDMLNDMAGGGAACFASHCDWRLPTIRELKGLLLEPSSGGACTASPCVDPDLPGDTVADSYWSSTDLVGGSNLALFVDFSDGSLSLTSGMDNLFVRAVRGGL